MRSRTRLRRSRGNKEFGFAERFNDWIARDKPGNDGVGGNGELRGQRCVGRAKQPGVRSHAARDRYLTGLPGQ
ncbi:hypothetical protein [Candidatus Spongiihabitans sp.]|uniref:hypothetical protein n=1 Tax=Candidatus Spongiihabitans sp. TaxID=3101308 RepID=UPI003C7D30AF